MQAADRLLVEKTADTNSPAPSSLNAATWEVSSNLETTGNASICFQLPKKYRKLLKNLVAMPIFSVFCGSLLPSWIRIRIRIQITDPDPMVRLNTDPDPKPCVDPMWTRIRIQLAVLDSDP